MARPNAKALGDRGYVHQGRAVPGQMTVAIGHEYSLAMALPGVSPSFQGDSRPWSRVSDDRERA